MSGYRQKFIEAVKNVTRCDNYQDGLKKFELLGLMNINYYRKYGGDWKKWVMYAYDLDDDEKDYIRDKIESNLKYNCICSHVIEKLSFWKHENIIYLIGCDCVKQHPYFDKFMTTKLKLLEEDLENLKKSEDKKIRMQKKKLDKVYKELELQTNNLYDTYKEKAERAIYQLEKKVKDNDHLIFNFLNIQLNFKMQRKTIKQLIEGKHIQWYISKHKFFTCNPQNTNKIKYIIDNKLYLIDFKQKYGWDIEID